MKKILLIVSFFISNLAIGQTLPTKELVARFNPSSANGIYYDDVPEDRETRTVQTGKSSKGVFTIPYIGNEYLNFTDSSKWTISFWMYTTTSVQTIFSKYNTTTGKGIQLKQISGSTLTMLMDGNGSTARTSKNFANIGAHGFTLTGKWVHVTIAYNGNGLSSGLNAFFQANQAGIPNGGVDTRGSAGIANTSDLKIGTTAISMFDFRMYNVVKTPSEIHGIANCNIDTTGLLVNLRLDEQGGLIQYNCYKTKEKILSKGQSVGNAYTTTAPTQLVQSVYSFQNTRGYNLSAGIYIPRNEADTNKVDALGSSLTYYKQVRYRMTVSGGVMNFNPDNAPLSKLTNDSFPFATLTPVPTAYAIGDRSKFGNGEKTNPLFVDRSDTAEKNYLIYRSFKNFYDAGKVEGYINHKTLCFVDAGQSNSDGMGKVSELPTGYTGTNLNSKLWSGTCFNSNDICSVVHVGPGLAALVNLTNHYNDIFYHIKYGVGSSSLPYILNYTYWYPVKGASNLYKNLLTSMCNATDTLIKSGRRPVWVLNWDQGETNSGDPNYGREFKFFVSSLRHDMDSIFPGYGFDSLQVVARLIAQQQTPTIDVSIIRNQMATCQDTSNTNFIFNLKVYDPIIDSLSLGTGTQKIHFTAHGQASNGTQVSNKIICYDLYKIKKDSCSSPYRMASLNKSYKSSNSSVYPNPSEGIAYVYSELPATIYILDSSGKQIQYFIKAPGNAQINEFPSGMYFVKIATEKESSVYKLIINK